MNAAARPKIPSFARSPSNGATYWRESRAVEVDESEARTIRFVASDETVDRYGDIVSVDGWQLSAFRRNPVFLWMHNYREPIGQVTKIGVEDNQLIATVRYASPGVSQEADRLWRLTQDKVLRAVSVGFTVNSDEDWEYIRDENNDQITGIRYLRQELLELSLVSVPANPAALALARALNYPDEFIRTALPLDASVRAQQIAVRQRIAAHRIAGMRASAPRQAR